MRPKRKGIRYGEIPDQVSSTFTPLPEETLSLVRQDDPDDQKDKETSSQFLHPDESMSDFFTEKITGRTPSDLGYAVLRRLFSPKITFPAVTLVIFLFSIYKGALGNWGVTIRMFTTVLFCDVILFILYLISKHYFTDKKPVKQNS